MADNIHKDHRKRVRNRFLKSRFNDFSEHEKLELLLYYAIPVKNTNPIAHTLLNKFRSIRGVFDATIDQLTELDGIGEQTAILIKLVPELAREYINSENVCEPLDNSDKVCNFFKKQFIGEYVEKIKAACIDDKLNLVYCDDIAEGTINSVCIDIKRLIQFVYENNCENVIIAHNHPNGDLSPSNDDIRQTVDMYKKLKTIGINLIDHVIVAQGQAISLKSVGTFNLL